MKYKKYFRKTSLKQKGVGEFFLNEIIFKSPKIFLEVGVFHGVTARNVCETLQKIHGDDFKYIGLDLFEESSEKYIVFHNQTIKLHWSISNNPLLKEKSLGKLINKDEHIFTIKKNMSYHFELKEDNTTIKKTLNFVTVRDNDFLNELKKKEFNSSIVKPKENFFNRFLNFLKNK